MGQRKKESKEGDSRIDEICPPAFLSLYLMIHVNRRGGAGSLDWADEGNVAFASTFASNSFAHGFFLLMGQYRYKIFRRVGLAQQTARPFDPPKMCDLRGRETLISF
jgi:hypothetical protein